MAQWKPHAGRPASLRVVLIGVDDPFSIAAFSAVASRAHVVGIVESLLPNTSDKPSRLAAYAATLGVRYHRMGRGNPRPGRFLSACRPDLICVAGMAQLLKPEEFSVPPLGAINLHPSLLPRYRGPHPLFWQAHAADLATGVTVHQIDAGMDTGDLLVQVPYTLRLGTRFGDVVQKVQRTGALAMARAVDELAAGRAKPRPQRHLPCPTPSRMVAAGDSAIDWGTWSAERVWHFLRAVPYQNRPTFEGAPPGRWTIGPLQHGAGDGAPGSVARDTRGLYLSHPAARVRLIEYGTPGTIGGALRRVGARFLGR